jgi:NhaP-type Na+/H+ or K+/H+ antiporter
MIGLATTVLLFRRLPALIALYTYIPAISDWKEAVFTGWFGPMGVGALFYYTIAIQYLDQEGVNSYMRQVIEPVIYFLILSSVVVHGITIPFYFVGTYASKTLATTSMSISSPRTSEDLEVRNHVLYP